MILGATVNHGQWEKPQNARLRGGPITEYAHIIQKQANKQNHTHKSKNTQKNPKQTKPTKIRTGKKPQTKHPNQTKPNQPNKQKTEKNNLSNKKKNPKTKIHWTVQATMYGVL